MKRVRRRKTARKRGRQRVRIGVLDPSLTGSSGVAAAAEFVEALDVVARLDRGVGSIKRRDRGASAGELLVSMAQSQLLGGDALVALDRQRQDVAATTLSAVSVLASITAAGLGAPRRDLRRQLIHVPARLARPQRRPVLHLPEHWPWATKWLAIWNGVFDQRLAHAPPAAP